MDNRISNARRSFSRMGFAGLTLLGATLVLQLAVSALLYLLWPDWDETAWLVLLSSFLPQYAVAVPISLLVFCSAPKTPLPEEKLSFKVLMVYLLVCLFMMYAGNLVGTGITSLLQLIPGVKASNPVLDMVEMDSPVLMAFIVVVLGPVVEELLFRKLLIDRLHVYGQGLTVVFSAALFGLFHGNLSQLFYAFALGLVFGYVYVRSGKLRYSIFLHMFVNFLGGVIAPRLLELVDLTAMQSALEAQNFDSLLEFYLSPGLWLFMGYSTLMLCAEVAGLVLLCINVKKIRFSPAPQALEPGTRFKTAFLNPGVISFSALCLGMIVWMIFI